jgi:hypothetical protein
VTTRWRCSNASVADAAYGGSPASGEAVVVPLVPFEVEPSTEVMLRMLLNRDAVVIQRVHSSRGGSPSGMVAQAGGAFARAISQATSQIGRAPVNEGLYRVILPTGSVARDLVPAVGGGFRGMVRSAGSTDIVGHARLVPAAVGGGAAIAAGPLLVTVGLAVAGEMLAQHQMNKKLNAIRGAVQGVKHHLDAQDRATLMTANQESRKVAGYLLDQAALPAIASAGHAFGDLASLTNRHIEQLDGWLEVAVRLERSARVNASDLMTSLIGKPENQIQEFERAVAQTYEALALRARVVVLEKVAAEFSNPGRSLAHVEEVLRTELAALADRQAQLVGLLDDLSAMQIDGSKVPLAIAGKRAIGVRTSFGRLARALHSTPDGLPLLTQEDRTVLELTPGTRGLAINTPATD